MDLHRPRISAVIPAYNAEAFLTRSVSSALRQTQRPCEVIVVDDGSGDGTARVAAEFGDPVRCVCQINAGASAARNRGIQEARGDFVAFLDADDEWLPRHLENFCRSLREHPDLVWFCDAYEARTSSESEVNRLRPDEYNAGKGYIEDYLIAAARSSFFHTDCIVARRSVFTEVGGFDTSLQVGEDLDMWFRIALRYPRMGYSSDIGAVYHRASSFLTTQSRATHESYLARIKRDESLACALGPEAVRRSEPLIRLWLARAVKWAAEDGNKDMLRKIAGEYGGRIPIQLRIVSLLCRLTPGGLWRPGFRALMRLRRELRP